MTGIEGHVDAFDIDVTFGPWPRRTAGTDLGSVLRLLGDERITQAAVCSTSAVRHDARRGNDETIAACAGRTDVVAAGVVDLRDTLRATDELDRLAGAGIRLLRLFPAEQDAPPESPGLRHVVEAAAGRFVIATTGDVRTMWRAFADCGACVVFLDTHFYHLADFLLLARRHDGFHTSTRLLNSPDAYEQVSGEVGVERLLFGSGTPRFEPAVPALRLAASPLHQHDKQRIAGGNLRALLQAIR